VCVLTASEKKGPHIQPRKKRCVKKTRSSVKQNATKSESKLKRRREISRNFSPHLAPCKKLRADCIYRGPRDISEEAEEFEIGDVHLKNLEDLKKVANGDHSSAMCTRFSGLESGIELEFDDNTNTPCDKSVSSSSSVNNTPVVAKSVSYHHPSSSAKISILPFSNLNIAKTTCSAEVIVPVTLSSVGSPNSLPTTDNNSLPPTDNNSLPTTDNNSLLSQSCLLPDVKSTDYILAQELHSEEVEDTKAHFIDKDFIISKFDMDFTV